MNSCIQSLKEENILIRENLAQKKSKETSSIRQDYGQASKLLNPFFNDTYNFVKSSNFDAKMIVAKQSGMFINLDEDNFK